MPQVEASEIVKIYTDKKNKKQKKVAVDNISFVIEKGEFIGYIGPNGAGKSTTIKMLTGILYPTSGIIKVLGKEPYMYRRENAMNIGVLFGQRSQLWWDLPVTDTLNLHRHMYKISKEDYKKQLDLIFDMFSLDEFSKKPIRQLSLGQRMRCELAVTLLHKPSVLFLDEPTIGMDIIVKEKIRQYLIQINKEEGVTILLTTHDLSEVERTCNRVMVVNQGKLLYDGSLDNMRQRYMSDSTVTITIDGELPDDIRTELRGLKLLENGDISFLIDRHKGEGALISRIYNSCKIIDLKTSEPPIEEVISELYIEKKL